MSDAVEWSIHCCTRAGRAAGGPGAARRPAGRVPRRARRPTWPRRSRRWPRPGSSSRGPGPLGGYRLGPVAGGHLAARHRAGRRRRRARVPVPRDPPARPGAPPTSRPPTAGPCGIARAMWRAEDAWRAELAAMTVGDMVIDFLTDASPARWCSGARVDPGSPRTSEGAGHEGVRCRCHRRARARHGPAAGRRRPRGAGRGPVAGEGRPAPRARAPSRCTVDLFDPASVRAAVDGCQGVVHMATNIPPLTKALEGRRLGHQRPPPPGGHAHPRRRLPRRRRGGAGEGDGVVLLRRTAATSGSTRTGRSSASPSATPRSTPRTPRSRSPATVAVASCCGSASSTPTTPVPSRRA